MLFLPVVGCGDENATGMDIIRSDKVFTEIKTFLIISMACGVIIILLKELIYTAVAAIFGIISLLVFYVMAKNRIDLLQLKAGAYLAIVAYLAAILAGFINGSNNSSKTSIRIEKHYSGGDKNNTGDIVLQIEKLAELKQKGLITEDEFNLMKRELLEHL
jgi:hypothetical protein